VTRTSVIPQPIHTGRQEEQCLLNSSVRICVKLNLSRYCESEQGERLSKSKGEVYVSRIVPRSLLQYMPSYSFVEIFTSSELQRRIVRIRIKAVDVLLQRDGQLGSLKIIHNKRPQGTAAVERKPDAFESTLKPGNALGATERRQSRTERSVGPKQRDKLPAQNHSTAGIVIRGVYEDAPHAFNFTDRNPLRGTSGDRLAA